MLQLRLKRKAKKENNHDCYESAPSTVRFFCTKIRMGIDFWVGNSLKYMHEIKNIFEEIF